MVRLSWSPRAYLLKGFLNDSECDHLIERVSSNTVASGAGVLVCWCWCRRAHTHKHT